jgi:hypothetical protein
MQLARCTSREVVGREISRQALPEKPAPPEVRPVARRKCQNGAASADV